MNGDCWSALWNQDGNLKGCNGRSLQIAFLAGAAAVLLFFTSVILLFLSLCCTVCKIRQLKRSLQSYKENPPICSVKQNIKTNPVNPRTNSFRNAPPIRLSLDRPMLDLPRRTSNTNSKMVTFPPLGDDVPNTQLGVYDLLTHEDDDAAANRVVELQRFAELSPFSEYAQVCEENDPSPPPAVKRRGNNVTTPAMFYSDLVARDRDSQNEDDSHIHRIIEL